MRTVKSSQKPYKCILQNSRGQIAIFVALVFQVLFVFFAMVVNVGLLVHQKINLQNSVDLAAYYGAMKQSEEMNAIAHINYQIRQSWKLLLWRHKMVGMAGFVNDTAAVQHPYDFQTGTFRSIDDNTEIPYFPSSCQAYYPFDKYDAVTRENYCQHIQQPGGTGISIPIPAVTIASGNPFLTFTIGVANATQALATNAVRGCREVEQVNWITLARYLAAHKMDVTNRKRTMYFVANGMSKDTKDFLDLDGESVRDGVVKTLNKNLSPDNREGTKESDIQFYNSLGSSSCGFVDNDAPPKWLVDVLIEPFFSYMTTECGSGNTPPASTNFKIKLIYQPGQTPAQVQPAYNTFLDATEVNYLSERIVEYTGTTPIERLQKLSLGVEKNPWCMAYVGVSAKATPSIPFSPFGRITLTARAFAKPFGGKIGPWYGAKWSSGAARSDLGKPIDPLVPERLTPGSPGPTLTNLTQATAKSDRNLNPNYSRYVGDKFGLNANLPAAKWAKAIHDHGSISFSWWSGLVEDAVDRAGPGDILAWDKTAGVAPNFRNLEIAAVAPDLFDTTYYSVEPDFYRNYAVRLEKRSDKGQAIIRGDLGARKSAGQKYESFSVKDQIALAADPAKSALNVFPELKYHLLNFGNLLTGWQGINPEDYHIDDSRFGKCDSNPDLGPIKDDAPPAKATAGNCRVGGRTGYSVKLVDEQYLKKSDLELGGEGTSGALLNPLPAGF